MDKPENPPAFPTDGRIQHGTPYDGMSLRDWFAGQALSGVAYIMFTDLGGDDLADQTDTAAIWAYAFADAMLTTRAKGGDDAG